MPFPHVQSEPVLVLVFNERRAVGTAGAAARIVDDGEEERICRAARRRGSGDGRIFTVGSSSTLSRQRAALCCNCCSGLHYRDFNEVG